jgi:hypothetical protein
MNSNLNQPPRRQEFQQEAIRAGNNGNTISNVAVSDVFRFAENFI